MSAAVAETKAEKQAKQDKIPDLLHKPRKKRSKGRTILLCAAAILLFVLGCVGTVLGTGIPFFLAAFAFLAICFPKVRGWVNRSERHLPYKFRLYLRRMLQKVPIDKFRAMFSKPPAGLK